MPCYFPLKGWRSRSTNESGKRSIVFDRRSGFEDQPVEVPCGQCIGCRLERSRQWAIRCMHEASLYDDNCFITLTYDDANMPAGPSLCLKDFQDFMKRLRKRHGTGIRFFHCGEYGENLGRPHYHAIIFNFDFKDKRKHKRQGDNWLYTSDDLSTGENPLWPWGHALIGAVTFESAAYVARYVVKKVTGKLLDEVDDFGLSHYETMTLDGEVISIQPEYVTMSRKPGIGKDWYTKFKDDMFPQDYVIVRGKKVGVPKFYDTNFEIDDPETFKLIKALRKYSASEHDEDQTLKRLSVREQVKRSQIRSLKRNFEND